MKWKPHGYQLSALKFMLAQEGAGLFLDPGLGKTSTTLAAVVAKKELSKQFKGVLVIAPLRVAQLVWPAEQAKWDDFADLRVGVLHGAHKLDVLRSKPDICVINPEGLEWLFNAVSIKAWPWSILVVDESTKFKTWTSKRMKLLRKHTHRFLQRWILTGAPAPNGAKDLFSQIWLLDFGKALGSFITEFRRRYMYQGGYMGYEWLMKQGAVEEINEKIKHLVMRLDAADWLELPARTSNLIRVELPPEARRIYKDLEREFFAFLNEHQHISPLNAGARGMKLRQITNGIVYDSEGEAYEVHAAKLDALDDLVEELSGEPVLVGVAFKHEVEAIRNRLGADVPYLGGGVSKSEAERIVAQWNAKALPVLLAHPASVAHGLNLQAGRHVCWFGLTWSLDEYDQFIRRVWRQGQEHRVIVHYILAADTTDEAIMAALESKTKTQAFILDKLREYAHKKFETPNAQKRRKIAK